MLREFARVGRRWSFWKNRTELFAYNRQITGLHGHLTDHFSQPIRREKPGGRRRAWVRKNAAFHTFGDSELNLVRFPALVLRFSSPKNIEHEQVTTQRVQDNYPTFAPILLRFLNFQDRGAADRDRFFAGETGSGLLF